MEMSAPGATGVSAVNAFTTPPGARAGRTSTGAGAAAITKLRAFETRRPGLDTVMLTLPAAASRFAVTDAVSCAVLANVVARTPLFHSTVEVGVKYAPCTVRVNAAPPSGTDDGLTTLATGV